MISYKDMTFCSSDCTNKSCYRFFSDYHKENSVEWWGSDEAPVAFSDFSGTCKEYKK